MVNRDKFEETTDRNEYQTGRPESAPEREKKMYQIHMVLIQHGRTNIQESSRYHNQLITK